ncbi:MAG: bifunctional phosphoribosyl-AMP cyclohydrolase/phosphoribosyl-ATP diphosphatase HisIE [Clostridiales bacterium]|jgi:phosphoribosyl-ATP pyrophosphohydrolase/phosphoribosyl-AMP cyclohydrolase|nr:bifunctional phosphoribosyl-AMP cyclohydrolase/phosphoribosyl-ATP diphosphatase HisIE [Clostridiales bacterium]
MSNSTVTIDNDAAARLKFDAQGLIPVVVQDFSTGAVLTLAYMNRESLEISLRERRTCFYSRSRGALWRKGETSGNVQSIVRIDTDCDYDALVVQVNKSGPACHTNRESCFFNQLFFDAEAVSAKAAAAEAAPMAEAALRAPAVAAEAAPVTAAPKPFSVDALHALLLSRKAELPEGSYTTYLFEKGLEKILKKVGEECTEVVIAAMKRSKEETVFEAADLYYHMLVLLCELGIPPSDIAAELAGRHVIDHKTKQETMV